LPGLELPEAAGVFLRDSGPGMGEYSGDILKSRQPQLYQAAMELLARGYGIRDTAQILKMSPRSIMAIRDREPEAIATIKHRVSRRFLDVATLAAEVARDRLTDDPDSISFKDLMIGGAVATDKHLILSGEATQRIEHVTRSGDDDFTRMLEDARARGRLIEGELLDTNMTAKDSAQGADDDIENSLPSAGPDLGADCGTGDMQSGVTCENPHTNAAMCADDTASATGGAAPAAACDK